MSAQTLVQRYNGNIVPIDKIKIGNKVIGTDGKPKKIIGITNKTTELYKITQKNGDDYIVDENHKLVLKLTNVECIYWDKSKNRFCLRYIFNLRIIFKQFPIKDHQNNKELAKQKAEEFLESVRLIDEYQCKGHVVEINVKEYIKLQNDMKRSLYGFKQAISFKERPIELDPYMLGVWLGDGTSSKPEITNIDKEVLDYLYVYADEYNLNIRNGSKYRYSFSAKNGEKNSLLLSLRKYNLLKNKHIPYDYLFNTEEIRLNVLAGLLDTDGHLTKNKDGTTKNYYEITQKNITLSHNIVFLARSLGFRASIKTVQKTCVKPNGDRIEGTYQRMNISGEHINSIPVKIPRKKAMPCGKDVDFLVNQIKIESIGKGNYTELQIKNNKRFILPDLTVVV